MKKWMLVVLAGVLAVSAYAINPTQRIGRLKEATMVTIFPHRGDPVIVLNKRDMNELLRHIRADSSAVRNSITGARVYELAFFRDNSKTPMETLWVTQQGVWGFKGINQAYGRSQEIVKWIENVEGH